MRCRLLPASAALLLLLSGCASSHATRPTQVFWPFSAPDRSGVRSAYLDPAALGCEMRGSFAFYVPPVVNSSIPMEYGYARARAEVKAMGGNTIFVKTRGKVYNSWDGFPTADLWATADAYACPQDVVNPPARH